MLGIFYFDLFVLMYIAKYAKIRNVKISNLVTFSKPDRHLA